MKPQIEDNKSGYKNFLDTLSKEVKKIRDAEENTVVRASAIEATVEFDEAGEPAGKSRPILPIAEEF